jgi:hypothetical protein
MARHGPQRQRMIYTIGYQRLTSRRLEKIVGDLNAILVDCRHRPFSQRPEFGGDRLAEQFGTRYQQRGHEPQRPDQPLDIRILPGRDRAIPNPHGSNTPCESQPVGAIIVTHQPSRSRVVETRPSDLEKRTAE